MANRSPEFMVNLKKVISCSRLIYMGALCLLALGTSCENTDDLDLNPTIRLKTSPSGTYILQEDTLKVEVRLTAVDGFEVFRIQEVNTGVISQEGSNALGSDPVTSRVYDIPLSNYTLRDTLVFEYFIQDKEGRTGKNSNTVIISAPLDSLNLVNNSDSLVSPGPFSGLKSGKTYTLPLASSNSDSVDFLVNLDTAGNWSLFSPDDSIASNVIYPRIKSWPSQNLTRFKITGFSREEFEELSNDGLLLEENFGVDSSYVANLSSGNVILSKTIDGKLHLLLVDEIQGNDTTEFLISWRIKSQF